MDASMRKLKMKQKLQNKIGKTDGLTSSEKLIMNNPTFFSHPDGHRGKMPSQNVLRMLDHQSEETTIRKGGPAYLANMPSNNIKGAEYLNNYEYIGDNQLIYMSNKRPKLNRCVMRHDHNNHGDPIKIYFYNQELVYVERNPIYQKERLMASVKCV